MKHLLNNKPIKIVLVILGYILWKDLLVYLVGSELAYGLFITQAIYCRQKYFRDDYVYGLAGYNEEIDVEVVEWTSRTMIH